MNKKYLTFCMPTVNKDLSCVNRRPGVSTPMLAQVVYDDFPEHETTGAFRYDSDKKQSDH